MTDRTCRGASAGTGVLDTPSAPLPPAGEAALSRLDRAFLPLPLVRAVTRYEIAAARYDELIARPASELSPAEFDSVGAAQQTMADSLGVLADAGRTDLLAPLWAADSYRASEARANELIAIGRAGCMSDLDADDLAHRIDLMAGYRATLAAAGRLDLIEAA